MLNVKEVIQLSFHKDIGVQVSIVLLLQFAKIIWKVAIQTLLNRKKIQIKFQDY